jgi:hypothetical protein
VQHGYCNVLLGVPQATTCYCAMGYMGAEAIMAVVPETT